MVDIIINCREDLNMKRVADLMNQAPDELKTRILQIFREEGAIIRDDAKANAPVKTGKLRDLIMMRETPTGVEVVEAAPYAVYQEFGTKFIQPRHFLTTAFKLRHPAIKEKITLTLTEYFRELT